MKRRLRAILTLALVLALAAALFGCAPPRGPRRPPPPGPPPHVWHRNEIIYAPGYHRPAPPPCWNCRHRRHW